MHIHYPPELPVSDRREDIAAAIRDHQVVIVAGETGSGKTTQLPKICLELGRGVDGKRIGHTQPRRIAARSVAERIADELGTELGDLVGYQVRFADRTSQASRVKLMTDGILLAELQHDRQLRRYDTIIVDEAHERSLNVDFILGYLRQLLPRRPDLKLIITSATIDPERFATHFAQPDGTPAPIIEVSGRTYPVEVRYRPLRSEVDDVDSDGEPVLRDRTDAIVDAVKELSAEGPGDILVFLPGEREIRDAAEAITGALGLDRADPRRPHHVEVLPLYSRLSASEQHRVFAPHAGRRVVLATNVAETSLTVPGIRYVVDTGLARISRWSARTKVQRLPIEAISQASANQRSGRCGRVAAGVAIRLYDEEDFLARPEFTDPEILRTNLASVILQMASLGLGDIARFPFVEPPDRRQVTAGLQLLEELGALVPAGSGRDSGRPKLTKLGRRLARLPIDPRLGRMILEAEQLDCLREVLVIAAALSSQDPRERPADAQAQADQLHARFTDPTSDFMAWLNLWRHLRGQQRELSSSAFRRLCKREYLNHLRVREWQELESQLRRVCKEMGLRLGPQSDGVDADAVHQALLSGLLSHIGMLEERQPGGPGRDRRPGPREYAGARGTRFAIFPGSGLKKKHPAYVMSAELVETTRLWGRQNAAIDPEWAERLGAHLVKRSWSEPHWSTKRAAVLAHEKVTLFGVTLVADRLVNYARHDAAVAREMFIRHALVQGEWQGLERHQFARTNRRLLAEAEELEHRARRRGIVVDEHSLFDFYDARVGADVVSGAHFDGWWKQARRDRPDLLTFDLEMLTRDAADDVDAQEYPEVWTSGPGLELSLNYHFEPGAADDGVTVDIPLSSLNRLSDDDFSWHVPGLREELVTALIRNLPKPLRVNFVPAPDRAREFLASVPPGSEPLLDALERWCRATAGVVVPREAWRVDDLPGHLRPTYRILDEDGRERARGKDLATLAAPLAPAVARALADVAHESGLNATGATAWTFGEIPVSFTEHRAGHEVLAHPALVDEGTTVGLQVFGSADEATARHRLGVRRLLQLNVPVPRLLDALSTTDKLALAATPYATSADLVADCAVAVLGAHVDDADEVRDPATFAALLAAARRDHEAEVRALLSDVLRVLAAWRTVDKALSGRADLHTLPARNDMAAQLGRLLAPGFIADAGPVQLRRYPAYLKALLHRRERLDEQVAKDRELMSRVTPLQEAWQHRIDALAPGCPPGADLRAVRWMLEEYRISLWAQHIGTAGPVSDARIRKLL